MFRLCFITVYRSHILEILFCMGICKAICACGYKQPFFLSGNGKILYITCFSSLILITKVHIVVIFTAVLISPRNLLAVHCSHIESPWLVLWHDEFNYMSRHHHYNLIKCSHINSSRGSLSTCSSISCESCKTSVVITRLKRGVQMSVVVVSDMIQSREEKKKALLPTEYNYYQQKLSVNNG